MGKLKKGVDKSGEREYNKSVKVSRFMLLIEAKGTPAVLAMILRAPFFSRLLPTIDFVAYVIGDYARNYTCGN